jgi:TIR domain
MARIFVSYSHADEQLLKQLEKHLASLRRSKAIDFWFDRRLVAGDKIDDAIFKELDHADLILLLISPDWLDSEYCNREMLRAMARVQAGQARVIPVILRHTDLTDLEPFRHLALPKDAKPVVSWDDYDEAWLDVVRGIRQVLVQPKPVLIAREPAVEYHAAGSEASAPPVQSATRSEYRPPTLTGDPGTDLSLAYMSVLQRNFTRFQWGSRQSEARTNLMAFYTACRAYHAEHDRYPTTLADAGFVLESRARYFYFTGKEVVGGDLNEDREEVLRRVSDAIDWLGVMPHTSPDSFLLVAAAQFPGGKMDVWVVSSQNRTPTCVQNGVE